MHKRHLLQIAVSVFTIILMGFSARAVPGTINYQGRLTDPNGAALEGDYEMGFSLYNTKTGGSDIWSEQQTVRITDGIYNVQLGAVNPLSIDLFNDDTLYLEVWIEDEVLYPRDSLTSTVFAMRAGVADMAIDAGTVGGIQPGDLLDTSSSTQTKSGGLNISGRLGVGTDTPTGALHVNGTSILEGTLNIDTKQAGTTSLDQSQTSKQLTSFLDDDWQSFTAGMEGILTRIEVLSVEGLSWGSTTLRIFEGEGTSGTSLYEGQYNIGTTASDGIVAFDIPIESGPGLSSGSHYTFQIESIDGFVWLEFNNPYAGGRSSFGADRDFWFKTYMRVGYNPGGMVTVTPDGNVGIGTMSPDAKLHLKGPKGQHHIKIENPDAPLGSNAMISKYSDGTLRIYSANWPAQSITLHRHGNPDGEVMRIHSNGNVGIGTTSPGAKLEVSGKIIGNLSDLFYTKASPGSGLCMGCGSRSVSCDGNDILIGVITANCKGDAFSIAGNLEFFETHGNTAKIGCDQGNDGIYDGGNIVIMCLDINP